MNPINNLTPSATNLPSPNGHSAVNLTPFAVNSPLLNDPFSAALTHSAADLTHSATDPPSSNDISAATGRHVPKGKVRKTDNCGNSAKESWRFMNDPPSAARSDEEYAQKKPLW